jgi:hypothetical protein
MWGCPSRVTVRDPKFEISNPKFEIVHIESVWRIQTWGMEVSPAIWTGD